ncbi:unnamed protein product [Bubo scandiacus]
MATTGLYKMGDGSNYATNCFPARNILCTSKEGDASFSAAATPRAWTGKGTTRRGPQQRRKPPESASKEENNEDNVLDEPFLMKYHCSKNPSDLCSVNISSQNLVSAKEDDFGKFDCVAFINAAENLLTLEPFRKFPGLRELELSLNGLRNLKITAGDFLHLEVVPREGESSILKTLPAPSMHQDVCAPFPELKRLSLAFSKVTSHLPKVTKRPLMLEAPAKTFLWKPLPAVVEAVRDAASPSPAQPLPLVSSVTAAGSWRTALGEGEGDPRPPPGSAEEDIASFFMMQVEDVSRPLLRPVAEDSLEKRSEQSGEGSSQVVPERYRGYEELLGGDTDPDFIEPVGIQKNMQALHNILKHPLVYPDAKPRLDSVQKPYVPRKKRGRMPGPPAHKTRAEVLEGILVTMRNTSTITEVPLASVLQQRKSSPRTYWEAWRLMEEFQEVFKILPETVTMGEEVAKPSFGAQVVEALLKEATSEQGSPQQQLPGKKVAKKVPKV